MKVVHLTPENCDAVVAEASEVLSRGGVIIYPTDTLYGLGGDALSDEALRKVCAIKERDERRPVHAIFSSMKMAEEYAVVSEPGKKLAAEFLPGPLTMIFTKKAHLKSGIARTLGTIGVRILKNQFCLKLAAKFGRPITTTSANITGKETQASIPEILAQLGEHADNVDLAIDDGMLPTNIRSTIVDVRDEPLVIRDGAIATEEIQRVLKGE